jgi:uncharacterized protein (DUF2164 family)
MSTELEDGLKNLGFDITQGEPPAELNMETPEVSPVPEDQQESVIDLSGVFQQEQQTAPEADSSESSLQEESTTEEPPQEVPQVEEDSAEYTDAELESAITSFIGERLGLNLESVDQLAQLLNAQNSPSIDERVKAIADFVSETGRDPMDWFRYQSINSSEMDDLTAVRLQLQTDYPNLSGEEVNLLLNSKYKIDEDLYSEDEIKLSKLQLKIDADKAKKEIERLRESYKMPILQNSTNEVESPITAEWLGMMEAEANNIDSLTFELGKDNNFEFAISPEYRQQMIASNSRLDEFFDQYVDNSGSWNYEMLHAHRALIDNIDEIAKSLYNQGLSDGRRQLVEKAANVDVSGPKPSESNNTGNIAKQLLDAFYGDNNLSIKL